MPQDSTKMPVRESDRARHQPARPRRKPREKDHEGATEDRVGDRIGPRAGYDDEPEQVRDRGGVES